MNPLTYLVVLAVSLSFSIQTASAAAPSTNRYRANVYTNSERNAFQLKAGHTTFDSFINAIATPAFTNTSELLKTLCEQSRRRGESPGRTNWQPSIDIDLALGTDYQMLRWLDSGRIDVAFVCPAALQLFRLGKTNATDVVRLDKVLGTNAALPFEPRLRALAPGNRQPRPDPEADYQAFLSSLTGTAPPSPVRLLVPSHLSAAGFITPLAYAHNWFRTAFPAVASSHSTTESNFWQQFFAHVEFSLGNAQPTAAAPEILVIEFSPDALPHAAAGEAGWSVYKDKKYIASQWLTNLLVARRAVAEQILSFPVPNDWAVPSDPNPVLATLAANESLRGFLSPKFSIPEIVRLIRCDQETSGKVDLALVLSGGGVKAAYQSALIDHLYGTRLLSNSTNNSANASPAPLAVKNIVGNSGGALLGFFIAGLEEDDSRRLTNVLWGAPGNLVTNSDIFGFWDMLRWASFVVCIWVFIATLRLASCLGKKWNAVKRSFAAASQSRESFASSPVVNALLPQPAVVAMPVDPRRPATALATSQFNARPAGVAAVPPAPNLPPQPAAPPHTLALRYWATMAGVLIATPLFFQIVNGEHGREHIPAIEGAFYFLCLCLAMLLDNCLFPTPEALSRHQVAGKLPVPGKTSRTWPPSRLAIVAAIGFLIAAIPVGAELLYRPRPVTLMLFNDKITIGGLLVCAGLLAFWLGMIGRLWIEKSRCLFNASWGYASTVLLGSFVTVTAYIVLRILTAANLVTSLELTLAFWGYLVLITSVLSALCYCLGNVSQCPRWLQSIPAAPWFFQQFKVAMQFQVAKHQSGFLGLSRLVRMHSIFTIGFVVWNLIVAPALYGNSSALGYLQGAYENFTRKQTYRLQTRYAAPANDLVAKRERYFLFHPAADDNSPLLTSLGNDKRARWTVHPFTADGHMKDVVFASGSPFPIFSPHAVRSRTETNWLVDGGYVHNVPLEAAKEIGSRQVILLNSSPIEEGVAAGKQTRAAGDFAFGQLVRNIPHLFPFLFDSSQVADFLVREHMFIVSLSPAPDKTWPPLFDFREATVEKLLAAAGHDINRRIGRIETAGPPVFIISIRMGRDEPRPAAAP